MFGRSADLVEQSWSNPVCQPKEELRLLFRRGYDVAPATERAFSVDQEFALRAVVIVDRLHFFIRAHWSASLLPTDR